MAKNWDQAYITDEMLQMFNEPLRASAQVMLRDKIEGEDGKNDFAESQRCVEAGLIHFYDHWELDTETVAKLICSAYLLGRQSLIVEIEDDPLRVLASVLMS